MGKPLRMLIVEDSEDDTKLLVLELLRAGYELAFDRVDTEEAMRAALARGPWDIVVCDYAMPSFSGPRALAVMRDLALDIPLIIVSGTIGEETAVQALKAGAHDFFLKGRLVRLVPAIERELREATVRSERRKAASALEHSERKYRSIVETTWDGVWTIDEQHVTTYANDRMASLLATTVEAMRGTSFFDFIDEGDRPMAGRFLERGRQGIAERNDLKLRRRDGEELWVSFSTNPILKEAGEYAGALAMVTDVTAQRALQTQLMVSDRMASVGTLAAGVAHEINNPLTAVIANLDLAELEVAKLAKPGNVGDGGSSAPVPADLAPLHECLSESRQAADRVRQIVHDIRIFSRAEEERRGPVDLRGVLESSLRLARCEIRHRARVVREYGEVPPVFGNESRLGQVFLNLIVNAAQAIPEGRIDQHEIRIKTSLTPTGQVMGEVSDSGMGMTSEVQSQVFRPFFTTKPRGAGTGLGLSICHRIVTSLGGTISVDSQVGRGTTFRVFLSPAAGQASDAAAPVGTAELGRRGRILVVDDEPMLASVIKRTLAPDHEVLTAAGGQAALEILGKGETFDVILCDLMMPLMTGMDLHAKVLRIAPEQSRHIIFLTGAVFTPDAETFLTSVPNVCLDKPFDPNQLRALVNERVRLRC